MLDKQSSDLIRLNKYLALSLGVSRREADNLIDRKQVKVNGEFAVLGARIKTTDEITVNDRPLEKTFKYEYIALNKPVGYVCSRLKQGENDTIYSLLPKKFHHLKTVGRLDKDSSGLILLTNDGDFTYKMTHPKFYKIKKYLVKLNKDLEPIHQQMVSDYGIELEDGPSKLTLERQSDQDRQNWIVTMHEGRNRQIRRTFSTLGYEVIKLHRTDFGNYTLANIKPGKFIKINL